MYGEMGKEETRPNVVFVETLTEGPDHWMFRKIILSCLDTLKVAKGIHGSITNQSQKLKLCAFRWFCAFFGRIYKLQ